MFGYRTAFKINKRVNMISSCRWYMQQKYPYVFCLCYSVDSSSAILTSTHAPNKAL